MMTYFQGGSFPLLTPLPIYPKVCLSEDCKLTKGLAITWLLIISKLQGFFFLVFITSITCEIPDYILHSFHASYIVATKEFKKSQSSEAFRSENCIIGASSVTEPSWIAAGGQQTWDIGLRISHSSKPVGSSKWGTGPGLDREVNREMDRWLDEQRSTQNGPWLRGAEALGIAGSALPTSPLEHSQGVCSVRGPYHCIIR